MSALTSRPSMSRISSTPSAISTMPEQPHIKQAAEKRRARAASNTSKPYDGIIESIHKHAWIIPGVIAGVIFVSWLLLGPSDESNPLRPFILLSYRTVNENGDVCYGKGRKDVMFFSFYVAVFTFIRELTMEMVLEPLARKTGLKKSKQGRFMEQCFSMIHFTISGLSGLVVPHLPHTK